MGLPEGQTAKSLRKLSSRFWKLRLSSTTDSDPHRPDVSQNKSINSNANPTFPVTGFVVGVFENNIIIEVEVDGGSCHFLADSASINRTLCGKKLELFLCQKIIIVDAVRRSPSTKSPASWRIMTYESIGGAPISFGQVVSVYKKAGGFVTVVGKDFLRPCKVPINDAESQKMKRQDFLMATFMELPAFTVVEYVDRNAFVKTDFESKSKYERLLSHHSLNPDEYPMPVQPRGQMHITSVRPLSKKERIKVANMCRQVTDDLLDITEVLLFIRDPLVAASRLEQLEKHLQALRHTVHIPVKMFVDKRDMTNVVTCRLSAIQVHSCINVRSTDSWRIGSELAFRHPVLARYPRNQQEVAMVIDDIRFDDDSAFIRLVGMERSKDLFRILHKANKNPDDLGIIGPSDSDLTQESMPEYIDKGFERFFTHRRDLFDIWSGRKTAVVDPKLKVDGFRKQFIVDKRPLDPSQLESMRTAASTSGWTCIAAPPGSGKTFMISALVAARSQEPDETRPTRIVISATTNVAVTNAIDAVHQHFPSLKVCREYSVRTESEISSVSAKLSLRRMAKDAVKYLSAAEMKNLAEIITRHRAAEAAMKLPVDGVDAGMKILNALRTSERMLRSAFKAQYLPLVYGSTAELVARNPDPLATHLILDEAAQMSPLAALALYVSLPNLQMITILGDSQQLGPFCGIEDDGEAKRLLNVGELTRLEALDTVTKQRLKTIYRCHPRIVDLMLKPLYGPDIIAGVRGVDRDIVRMKDLPAATDGSPCVFVHIENSDGESGINKAELSVAQKLINTLKSKGVAGEDVAVITHHRAQRAELVRLLKGTGSVGTLRLAVGVYTIDSFQGKEAKIVIVLTTKTCKVQNQKRLLSILGFVSNPNRETVAVSRAQHGLYVLGDWTGLARTPFWNQFGENLKQAGAIVDQDFKKIVNPNWLNTKGGKGCEKKAKDRKMKNMHAKKSKYVVNDAISTVEVRTEELQKINHDKRDGAVINRISPVTEVNNHNSAIIPKRQKKLVKVKGCGANVVENPLDKTQNAAMKQENDEDDGRKQEVVDTAEKHRSILLAERMRRKIERKEARKLARQLAAQGGESVRRKTKKNSSRISPPKGKKNKKKMAKETAVL